MVLSPSGSDTTLPSQRTSTSVLNSTLSSSDSNSTLPSQRTSTEATSSSNGTEGTSVQISMSSSITKSPIPSDPVPTVPPGNDKNTSDPSSTSPKSVPLTTTRVNNSTGVDNATSLPTGHVNNTTSISTSPESSSHPAVPSSASSRTVSKIVTETGPPTSLTSTITDQPESTFSSPVSITLTNTTNGKVSLSVPPLVTIFSTTSEPNGSVVTFTHVVANPTGIISGSEDTVSSSFLSSGGKVAGVFVVVGILTTALCLLACITFRRRRRQLRGQEITSIQEHSSPNPFEESPMVQIQNPFSDPQSHKDQEVFDGNPRSHMQDRYNTTAVINLQGPFSDIFAQSTPKGVTASQSTPSLAQSSPSLYPATLPADDNEPFPGNADINSDTKLVQRMEEDDIRNKVPPPRPPRSPFREVATFTSIYPITPPPSVSSCEHDVSVSMPPSPSSARSYSFSGPTVRRKTSQEDILARPTILDVRRRPSEKYGKVAS